MIIIIIINSYTKLLINMLVYQYQGVTEGFKINIKSKLNLIIGRTTHQIMWFNYLVTHKSCLC